MGCRTTCQVSKIQYLSRFCRFQIELWSRSFPCQMETSHLTARLVRWRWGLFVHMKKALRQTKIHRPTHMWTSGTGRRLSQTVNFNIAYLEETVEKDLQGYPSDRASRRSPYDIESILPKQSPFYPYRKDWWTLSRPNTEKERENAICKDSVQSSWLVSVASCLTENSWWPVPDYDDWTTEVKMATRGWIAIFVWIRSLGCAFELSSVGIRVDEGMPSSPSGSCRRRRSSWAGMA